MPVTGDIYWSLFGLGLGGEFQDRSCLFPRFGDTVALFPGNIPLNIDDCEDEL